MASLTFLGAARTVTGSKHLLEVDGHRILFDCGMFQGLKELRERNWLPLPVPPDSIETVVLTHAHIDHSGWLPRLVQRRIQGQGALDGGHRRSLQARPDRRRSPAGRRREVRQQEGLFETRSGAAALHARRTRPRRCRGSSSIRSGIRCRSRQASKRSSSTPVICWGRRTCT